MMQFSLIDSVFNSPCLKRKCCCRYLDSFVLKLYIFNEIVTVKRTTETEFVRLKPSIFDANLGIKLTVYCVNTD